MRMWRGIGAVCVGLTLTACTAITTRTTYTVDQTALMPAPSGPKASGAILKPGQHLVEGGASMSVTSRATTRERRDAVGQRVADKTLHGRWAVALDERFEFGLDVSYANAAWGTSSSIDRDAVEFEGSSAHSFWAGAQLRVLVAGDPNLGVLANAEFDLGSVPYQRFIFTSTEVVLETSVDDIEVPVFESAESVTRSTLAARGRAGVEVFGVFSPGFIGSGGLSVQTQPRFFGQRVTTTTCRTSSFNCEGERPADLEPSETTAMLTPYVTGAYTLPETGISVLLQVHVHALGDPSLRATNPLGGQLRLRYTF